MFPKRLGPSRGLFTLFPKRLGPSWRYLRCFRNVWARLDAIYAVSETSEVIVVLLMLFPKRLGPSGRYLRCFRGTASAQVSHAHGHIKKQWLFDVQEAPKTSYTRPGLKMT